MNRLIKRRRPTKVAWVAASVMFGMANQLSRSEAADRSDRAPVTISGGHDLGKNDYGRPVPLIAAALGVQPDVFRKAFSGVTPARGRQPSGSEARKNKEALLKVLAPHGVTNERLDEVSNYYRFRPQRGELWPTKAAKAHAVIDKGRITRIVVDSPGSGYSSPPRVNVEGFPNAQFDVALSFSTDFDKNGAIKSIKIRTRNPKKAAGSKRIDP